MQISGDGMRVVEAEAFAVGDIDAARAEGAEIRYAINGLLSLTPDGAPILRMHDDQQRRRRPAPAWRASRSRSDRAPA